MKNAWRAVVLAFILPVSGAGAQEAPAAAPLDLGVVVEAALASHPSVAGAAARLRAAEAVAAGERAARLPTVATTATLTRYEKPMVVAPLHGFDPMSPPSFDETLYQGHAAADYTLFDGGARRSRIRAAERVAGGAEAGVAAARDAVVAEAVSSYLAVLTAEAVRAAHAQRVAALETERGRAALLLEQGKAPRVAVLRTEAAVSRARAELEAAAGGLELALRRLARVSGLELERIRSAPLREVSAAADQAPEREALMAAALESNPRLREAERRVAAAEAGVGAARAANLPRVSLAGRYSAFGSPDTELQPEWNAGVQVSYPLFTGGARGRAVERARAEASGAEAEARLVAREVADAVDRALLAHRSARSRVTALEAAVAQSAEVARIEALALDAGAGVQTDYLQAEAGLLEARAALAEARHAVVEARVRLAQATGRLTVEWITGMTEVER